LLWKVRRRRLLVTPLAAAILLLGGAASATADPFLPPAHRLYAGVTDKPVVSYVQAVGKHPAVYQEFVAWGQYLPAITHDATDVRARLMMAITTAYGAREAITPLGIALGRGDAWLIGLNHALFDSGNVTYVRLMGEMDGYWNPFCAYNADGSARDPAHSTRAYRQAWRRVALILRGGSAAHIDGMLTRLGMPRLRTGGDLPRPKVAMLWVPEAAPGNPAVAGNQPRRYWPGGAWVDWVGTDFYSSSPNFPGISALYNEFPGKPFVFGEYALWGGDSSGFVDRLFRWVGSHRRTRMLIYNQGARADGPFRLSRYPHAAGELWRLLASPRFPGFAPEFRPGP
jgi:hypothetical protein